MKTERKTKIKALAIICLLLVAGYFIRQNSHVRFQDENMGIVICNTIGGVTPETVRYKDLKEVSYLSIGCIGYYTTLSDIKKCTNIEELNINGYLYKLEPAYDVTHDNFVKTLTEEDSLRIEEELETIVPELKKLRRFWYGVYDVNSDIRSWDFLAGCPNLVHVYIYGSEVKDYSFLCTLENLRTIDLSYSRIATADSLLNLQDPVRLCIYDTPLAENEEEIQRLCEALPNTELLISGDRLENKQDWEWSELYGD